jgi:acetyl esterase/lipase
MIGKIDRTIPEGPVVIRSCAVLIVAVAAVPGFSGEPAKAPSGTQRHLSVPYAKVGNETLRMDLFIPASGKPVPVVVCIHGGAWKYGDRHDLAWSASGDTFIASLLNAGYACATIDYRLAPKHKFPAQIEDCKTAVRFLRSKAAQYGLDDKKIAAAGFSAGGHLASLLGNTDSDAGFDGPLLSGHSSKVACVLDYFGPTDLCLYYPSEGLRESFMMPWLGKDASVSLDVYRKASPVEYVSRNSVPHLIVHGTFDLTVPVIHAERLRDKLKAQNVPHECHFLTGRMHGWPAEDARKTDLLAVDFLKKHLPAKTN